MPPVVELAQLTKRFSDLTAVDHVDLTVATGEVFGFLGPNGAGKTTTIRCMLGFISPTSGTIRLLGESIGREPGAVLDRIGSLPGEFGLWPGLDGAEVLDYLASLTPAPPIDRDALLDRFELSNADLRRPVRTYSRGMRQKLGLVQAFQHRPALVILDEPTEGLDPLMQQRFLELLAAYRRDGGTVFMSSHILSEVEASATIIGVIKRGRLIRIGSPSALAGAHHHRGHLVLRDPSASLDRLAATAGVEELRREGAAAWFAVRGEPGPVLRELGALDLLACTIEPPSLADAFLGLYDDEGRA